MRRHGCIHVPPSTFHHTICHPPSLDSLAAEAASTVTIHRKDSLLQTWSGEGADHTATGTLVRPPATTNHSLAFGDVLLCILTHWIAPGLSGGDFGHNFQPTFRSVCMSSFCWHLAYHACHQVLVLLLLADWSFASEQCIIVCSSNSDWVWMSHSAHSLQSFSCSLFTFALSVQCTISDLD